MTTKVSARQKILVALVELGVANIGAVRSHSLIASPWIPRDSSSLKRGSVSHCGSPIRR